MAGFLDFSTIEEMLLAVSGEIRGMDTEDREYESIEELWKFELHQPALSMPSDTGGVTIPENHWYSAAFQYWESEANCPLSGERILQSSFMVMLCV